MNIWEAAPYISCSKALSLNDSNFFPASIMSILSIVMLICFSVGLPVLLISLLFYNKTVLFTQRIRMRLGFLYEAYRVQFFWWETIGFIRRFVFSVQASYGLSIGAFLVLQLWLKPLLKIG